MKWWAFSPTTGANFDLAIAAFEKRYGHKPVEAQVPLASFNELSGQAATSKNDAQPIEYHGVKIAPEPHGFQEIGFFRCREEDQ